MMLVNMLTKNKTSGAKSSNAMFCRASGMQTKSVKTQLIVLRFFVYDSATISFRSQDGQVNCLATLTTGYGKVAEHAGHTIDPLVSTLSMVIVVLIRKATRKAV
jgi:hypothetical protein